ncbi:MAG: prepilin peptidase [Cellulosilyticaceae bacterium]
MTTIIFILLGLIIGSFLNVCIYRIPEGQSINYPPSHCQKCAHRLGVFDLVPVVSWLCLRGRCRYCGEPISPRYMGIEVLNGLMYGLAIAHFGLTVEGIMACGFISVVVVLTFIDIDHMLLPTGVTLVGCGIAVIGRGAQSVMSGDWSYLTSGLLGGLLGYGVFALLFYVCLWLLKKEGMGYGDVEYLGMLGLFTSPMGVFLILLLSSVSGAIYGLALYGIHKESRPFPFGPFLSMGGLIAFFYGNQLISWYFGLFL